MQDLRQSLARFIEDSDTPGGALAWSTDGGQVQTAVAGSNSEAPLEPITEDSQFPIASLTKIFTGVLILRLIDEGHLRLDEPIGSLLPDWPETNEITIRQLLSHSSGLAPQGDDDGDGTSPYGDAQRELLEANAGRCFTLEESLEWLRGRPLLSHPGTRTRYSNTNFILAARTAELVTGSSYVQLLHEYVLDPLDLVDTWYPPAERSPSPGATGNGHRDRAALPPGEDRMISILSHLGPAGGLRSTAHDLCTFGLRVLRNHELIDERLAAEAFAIGPGAAGLGVLGVARVEAGHAPFPIFATDQARIRDYVGFGGSGLLPGTNTKLVYLTESDAVITLLFNRSSPPGAIGFLRDLIAAFSDIAPSS
jgi:D-alanyl-D-alanine carboxypeptidase